MIDLANMIAPWNASWSGEARYEIRPCRWASGSLALWQPFAPGAGRPIFAKPHFVRQRQSIAAMICTVCGEHAPPDDRWWFALGEYRDEWFMTTEAPVHRACAEIALERCPHLRRNPAAQNLSRFPAGYRVLGSVCGGPEFERDFGVRTLGRRVIGALKLAWPRAQINIIPREP